LPHALLQERESSSSTRSLQLLSLPSHTSVCGIQLDDDCALLEEEYVVAVDDDDDELRAEDEDETWHICASQSVR